VVASDCIEIATDGINAIKFVTDDAGDLARKINLVLSDPDLRETLMGNGRKEAEEKYARIKLVRETEGHYLRALDQSEKMG